MSSALNHTSSARTPGRKMAWVLLCAMAISVVHPLARVVEARSAAGYTEWLLQRGVSDPTDLMERALRHAAAQHHSSIEAFVSDFVTMLADEGGLEEASRSIGSPDGAVLSADELAGFFLADLRALSPKDPVPTARLNPSDAAGLPLVSRLSEAPTRAPRQTATSGVDIARTGQVGPLLAQGLTTSIQSLGP